MDWLFAVGLITISADTVFVWSVPFTIRLFQLVAIPWLAVQLWNYRSDRWTWRFDVWIILWCGIDFIQGLRSGHTTRSVAYSLWELNLALIIIGIRKGYGSPPALKWLFRMTLYSVIPVCVFGLVQLAVYTLFGRSLLLGQVMGSIPRLDGWSYEPSYYSTFLIAYFVAVSELLVARSGLMGKRSLKVILLLVTVNLLLSTSRIGVIGLGIYAATYFSPSRWRRLSVIIKVAVFAAVLTIPVAFVTDQPRNLGNDRVVREFVQGTGLYDTGDWTVTDRMEATYDTWDVFKEHPLWGRGLGAIPFEIAELHGVHIEKIEDTKLFESGNVLVGVLAAGGVLNAAFFAACLVVTLAAGMRAWRSLRAKELVADGRAFMLGAVFMFFIVQFNQNILRNYLWFWWGVALCACDIILKSELGASGGTGPLINSEANLSRFRAGRYNN